MDSAEAWDTAHAAVTWCRTHRRPTFLHLGVVRMLGHAGSDVEQSYRDLAEIEATEARDPLLATALLLVAGGWLQPQDAIDIYEEIRARVAALADEAVKRPKLTRAADVIAALAPHRPDAVAATAAGSGSVAARTAFHEGKLPEEDRPRHLARQINRALGDLLTQHPELIIFGEDVARKGGVYNVTNDLSRKAGVGRVFNTTLDETSILGIAMGAAHLGLLPVPEVQYLAYLHNAIDQLRGEAASLQFFSTGQFRNPMVVRIASLAYQKGFGGHFHNDNSVAALLDIPGIIVACPSNGEDAVGLLRTCVAAAREDGAVCVFLEPIALYMTKDLYADRDGAWSFPYPAAGFHIPVGRARTWDTHALGRDGDLTILTFGNGAWMSLRVAQRLAADGIAVRVVDLRWFKPLPVGDMVEEAVRTGRVLVVDETRHTGGVGEGIITALVEHCPEVLIARVAGLDTFIPLGAAANLVLVQEPDIEAAARALVTRPLPARSPA